MPDGWHLLGAGSMGSLAATRFIDAGFTVRLAGTTPASQVRHLHWPDGHQRSLLLEADPTKPIKHLIVATKAADTARALYPLLPRLSNELTLVRLQNGLGSLDKFALPERTRLVEVVTTSGAWREQQTIHVVAENDTLFGDGSDSPPGWFAALEKAWPGLRWSADIHHQQLLKLSVNAVINPLTALHDCTNGSIADDPRLQEEARALATEVDLILAALAPDWPGDSATRSFQVARQTAGNTSSMRADLRAGRITEIDFINGWLLRQARNSGIPAPLNQAIYQAVLARHP